MGKGDKKKRRFFSRDEDRYEELPDDAEIVETDLEEDDKYVYEDVHEEYEIEEDGYDDNSDEYADDSNDYDDGVSDKDADSPDNEKKGSDGKIVSMFGKHSDDEDENSDGGDTEDNPADDSENAPDEDDYDEDSEDRDDEPDGDEEEDDGSDIDDGDDEDGDDESSDNGDDSDNIADFGSYASKKKEKDGEDSGDEPDDEIHKDFFLLRHKSDIIFIIVLLVVLAGAGFAGLKARHYFEKKEQQEAEKESETAETPDSDEGRAYSYFDERDLTESGWEVGGRVFFGSYPQGAEDEVYDMAWKVIAVEDGNALLVSEYVLEAGAFDTAGKVQWESSTARSFLNGDFFDTAFTDAEKERILTSETENEDNPTYKTDGGHDTKDKVFLLGAEDIDDYLKNADLKCLATPHAVETGVSTGNDDYVTWWLRTPGATDTDGVQPGYTSNVDANGSIKFLGNDATFTNIGLRPAVWVKIDQTNPD